jgi:hypothetical protein
VSWPDKPKYVWNVRHRKNRKPEPPLKEGPLGIDCLQHYPQAHCFIQVKEKKNEKKHVHAGTTGFLGFRV